MEGRKGGEEFLDELGRTDSRSSIKFLMLSNERKQRLAGCGNKKLASIDRKCGAAEAAD